MPSFFRYIFFLTLTACLCAAPKEAHQTTESPTHTREYAVVDHVAIEYKKVSKLPEGADLTVVFKNKLKRIFSSPRSHKKLQTGLAPDLIPLLECIDEATREATWQLEQKVIRTVKFELEKPSESVIVQLTFRKRKKTIWNFEDLLCEVSALGTQSHLEPSIKNAITSALQERFWETKRFKIYCGVFLPAQLCIITLPLWLGIRRGKKDYERTHERTAVESEILQEHLLFLCLMNLASENYLLALFKKMYSKPSSHDKAATIENENKKYNALWEEALKKYSNKLATTDELIAGLLYLKQLNADYKKFLQEHCGEHLPEHITIPTVEAWKKKLHKETLQQRREAFESWKMEREEIETRKLMAAQAQQPLKRRQAEHNEYMRALRAFLDASDDLSETLQIWREYQAQYCHDLAHVSEAQRRINDELTKQLHTLQGTRNSPSGTKPETITESTEECELRQMNHAQNDAQDRILSLSRDTLTSSCSKKPSDFTQDDTSTLIEKTKELEELHLQLKSLMETLIEKEGFQLEAYRKFVEQQLKKHNVPRAASHLDQIL